MIQYLYAYTYNIAINIALEDTMTNTVDVACLIHGDAYDWQYVENLRHMIQKNTVYRVNFHVLTEAHRAVPDSMIKHNLVEWPGISGPKKSWWYKMQLFAPGQFSSPTTYFDLDMVVIDKIDWLFEYNSDYFWTLLDFKYLWKSSWRGINSSIMRWNPNNTAYIWDEFDAQDINKLIKTYHGDQDYLSQIINKAELRYIDKSLVHSWRWQIFDGGLDIRTRKYQRPGAGAVLHPTTKLIVFHGQPKPHDVTDPAIRHHWNSILS